MAIVNLSPGERIRLVHKNRHLCQDDLLCLLRTSGVVSRFYSYENLVVDRWFVQKRYLSARNLPDDICSPEFSQSIWFRVLLHALLDASRGRPCDLGIWRVDCPPGNGEKCERNVHICSVEAMNFLRQISDEEEQFAGLCPGTIQEYLKIFSRERVPC